MSTNPLLSKVKLPGRVFQLPSKGLLYEPDVLAKSVNNGEIEVKPMSALTEIKLRSADLLLSGKVLYEVCHECIPEILKPEKLVTQDIDAIFCFLVASTYGDNKKINAIHDCKNSQFHDYEISLTNIMANPRNQALEHHDLLYRVELSNTQVVNLCPITFESGIPMANMRSELMQLEMEKKTIPREKYENMVIADLMTVIDSVEDVVDGKPIKINDSAMINEWLRTLTKRMTEEIVSASEKASSWGFDFVVDLTCKDCGESFNHDLELNPITFFSG